MTDTGETCHYLEAAPDDMASRLAWASPSNYGTIITYNPASPDQYRAIGTGRRNTALILAKDANAPAAKACNEYSNNNKTDWFLPSLDELNLLYNNRVLVGNLTSSNYWSSSQPSVGSYAYARNFGGSQGTSGTDSTCYVRAIRAF